MKWIGQHIWSFISRFRNDVYMEDVSSGTIASGGNLGLDSNNKVVKATVSGADTTYGVSCVDGDNSDEEKIRLTGSDSSTDDVVLEAGTGLSIARSGDKITFTNTVSDTDTNTQNTYAISCVDGDNSDEEKIRLTQGGADGAATDDVVLEAGTGLSIARSGDKITFTNTVSDTNTQLTTEQVQDIAGDMVTGNTETNITVTYQAADGTFDFEVPDASTSAKGVIEVAEGDEVADGTDASKAVVPSTLKNNFPGSTSIVTLGTVTTGTWNGAKLDAIYTSSSGRRFGSTIKLIPSDFSANDDGGNTKFGVGYVDHAGTGYGMRPANSNTELFAFVSIPEGMTATHVHIYAKGTYAIEVFDVEINATTMTSKGTGNCNTNLDITDVDASATNFLAISIDTTSTSDRVYGGIVTIANQ